MTSEFDQYSNSYQDKVQKSIDFIGQDHDYFVRAKARRLTDVARRRIGDPKQLNVLDVGCGVGLTDSHLIGEFGDVYGADVSQETIKVAAQANPAVTYRAYDGNELPFSDDHFDVTFAVGVIHHVPPSSWSDLVKEMARVTSPRGLLIIFEHNPFNPLTRLAVRRCEFDSDVVLLSKRKTERLLLTSGLSVVEDAYILFLPWALPFSNQVETLLRRAPIGAQYFVAAGKGAAGPLRS
jgi:SAM-dependent methyltransferase